MPETVTYVLVENGVTTKEAESGSRFEQRLARSKKWRKVDKDTSPRNTGADERAARREARRAAREASPEVYREASDTGSLPPFPDSAYPPGAVALPVNELETGD